ncbi:MAG: TRAP transporter small permease subunit [Thioalkalivibrio sp.]|jgi:TRAP-type mannitol/chloroaromatic compound transport system permease small subunit|nr:TRAP transporter small permease subunit [Thioalkalivibrio sp.]
MRRITFCIERSLARVTRLSGGLSALAMVAMIVLIFGNVIARYLFGAGTVWLQELEWYLLSLSVMSGIAYAMRSDDHVRVDVFSHRLGRIGKYWLDLATMVLIALPVALLVLFYAWPFVETSFMRGEGSPNRSGMPWLFLPKGMILLGFALIAIEALRQTLRIGARLVFHYRHGHRFGGPHHAA